MDDGMGASFGDAMASSMVSFLGGRCPRENAMELDVYGSVDDAKESSMNDSMATAMGPNMLLWMSSIEDAMDGTILWAMGSS